MIATRLARLVSGTSLRTLTVATFASYGGLAFAALQGWPLWALALAALAPWMPVFALLTQRTARLDPWLAFFLVLTVSQTGHVGEHVAQLVQLHLLGLRGVEARGVVGTLDVEWVHVVWNSWVLLAVAALLSHYRSNRWLWLVALLAGWHEIEHVSIMSVFLRSGVAGTPGLLAADGALLGGLPVSRPDLHFLYNLAETTPLLIAFVFEARRTLLRRPPLVA